MKFSSFSHFLSLFNPPHSPLRPLHTNDHPSKAAERQAITGERLRWHDRWPVCGDARRRLDLKEHSQHTHLQHIVEPRPGLGRRSTLCARIILLDIFIETYEIHAFVAIVNVKQAESGYHATVNLTLINCTTSSLSTIQLD